MLAKQLKGGAGVVQEVGNVLWGSGAGGHGVERSGVKGLRAGRQLAHSLLGSRCVREAEWPAPVASLHAHHNTPPPGERAFDGCGPRLTLLGEAAQLLKPGGVHKVVQRHVRLQALAAGSEQGGGSSGLVRGAGHCRRSLSAHNSGREKRCPRGTYRSPLAAPHSNHP